jgi:hypothetical protein
MQDLQMRVEQINGSLDKWGAFNIVFVGRRTTRRSSKQFIADTDSKVLIERVVHLNMMRR